MIYVKLYGRLGNNLFQLAAAASLAHQNNDLFCPVIDKKVHDLFEFYSQFTNNVLRNVPYPVNIEEIQYSSEYKETGFHYSLLPYQPNILLHGYFQSPSYFDETTVRNLLRPSKEIREEISAKYTQIKDHRTTAIMYVEVIFWVY